MQDNTLERQAARIIFNLIGALEAAAKQPCSTKIAQMKLQQMSISPMLAARICDLLDYVVEHNLY